MLKGQDVRGDYLEGAQSVYKGRWTAVYVRGGELRMLRIKPRDWSVDAIDLWRKSQGIWHKLNVIFLEMLNRQRTQL